MSSRESAAVCADGSGLLVLSATLPPECSSRGRRERGGRGRGPRAARSGRPVGLDRGRRNDPSSRDDHRSAVFGRAWPICSGSSSGRGSAPSRPWCRHRPATWAPRRSHRRSAARAFPPVTRSIGDAGVPAGHRAGPFPAPRLPPFSAWYGTTGYGTCVRRSGSIASRPPAGGRARWAQSRRSQMRQPRPIGVAAKGSSSGNPSTSAATPLPAASGFPASVRQASPRSSRAMSVRPSTWPSAPERPPGRTVPGPPAGPGTCSVPSGAGAPARPRGYTRELRSDCQTAPARAPVARGTDRCSCVR